MKLLRLRVTRAQLAEFGAASDANCEHCSSVIQRQKKVTDTSLGETLSTLVDQRLKDSELSPLTASLEPPEEIGRTGQQPEQTALACLGPKFCTTNKQMKFILPLN